MYMLINGSVPLNILSSVVGLASQCKQRILMRLRVCVNFFNQYSMVLLKIKKKMLDFCRIVERRTLFVFGQGLIIENYQVIV